MVPISQLSQLQLKTPSHDCQLTGLSSCPRYNLVTDCIENNVSHSSCIVACCPCNNSSIAACWFVAAEMCLGCCCLAVAVSFVFHVTVLRLLSSSPFSISFDYQIFFIILHMHYVPIGFIMYTLTFPYPLGLLLFILAMTILMSNINIFSVFVSSSYFCQICRINV
jgi:hypothetical protein